MKKKSSKKMFSSSDVKRWFKVEKVIGEDGENELALCYYQNSKSKDCKGWIFISDITDIVEDPTHFTVMSAHRSLCLEAVTRAEHRLWLQGLMQLCPQALINGEAQQKPPLGRSGGDSKGSDRKRSQSPMSAGNSVDGGDHTPRGKSGRSLPVQEDYPDAAGGRGGRNRDGRSRETSRSRGGSREREVSPRDDSMERDRGLRYREDHRLSRNELPSTGATASARMHGHISRTDTEDRDRERAGSRPSSKESLSGAPVSQEHVGTEELESLDLNAPTQMTREALLRERQERLRSSQDEDKDADDGRGVGAGEDKVDTGREVRKARAPAGPPPRRARDLVDSDDDMGADCKRVPSQLASSEIDDMRSRGLGINLDDSDDENMEMDFKAEKRRYNTSVDDKSMDGKSIDSSGSRPPRPPPKSHPKSDDVSAYAPAKESSKAGPGDMGDANFVNDDWDESFEESPVKLKREVTTGSRPDNNWLEEDFDD